MIFDFEDPAQPAPSRADVCIVGAGAAGISLAIALERRGQRVVLLEGGGKLLERRAQELYTSEVTGLPYYGIHHGRLRVLGGTTTEWGGQIMELDERDFTAREHVQDSGWPIQKSDLDAYYRLAETIEGLPQGLPAGDSLVRQLPLSSREVSTAIARFLPERNFSRIYLEHLRQSERIHLYLHANLLDLKLNPERTAIATVRMGCFSGRTAQVRAGSFVLCTGGIESTRLLLQPPAEGTLPWQTNGLLGRFYQDHIACNGIVARDLAIRRPARVFGQVRRNGSIVQTKLNLSPQAQNELGTLNVSGTISLLRGPDAERESVTMALRRFRQRRSGLTIDELRSIARFLPAIAANWLTHRFSALQQTMLQVNSEQSPTSASTITLSDQRDSLGLFRTRLHWTISSHEIYSIRTYVRTMQQSFARSSFGTIEPPAGFFEDDAVVVSMCRDSNHHMGSTRMSQSPASGVVDPDLRLHGVRNGYVCSSSVFPTGGSSNPTHTVIALAMRLANHLTGAS